MSEVAIVVATHLTLPAHRGPTAEAVSSNGWAGALQHRSACHENLGSGPTAGHGTGSSRPIIETRRPLYGTAKIGKAVWNRPLDLATCGTLGRLLMVRFARGERSPLWNGEPGQESRETWELFAVSYKSCPPSWPSWSCRFFRDDEKTDGFFAVIRLISPVFRRAEATSRTFPPSRARDHHPLRSAVPSAPR